jgi:amidohydrolase
MIDRMVMNRMEWQYEETVAGLESELVQLRRSIHRRPELSGAEAATAALVADSLRSAGLTVSTKIGGHGVIAVLNGIRPGGTVAYRADMDAVADDEARPGDFRSEVAGAAHLCGHDLHTTIGIGVARTLARFRDRLPGRVIFYFQPAEETLCGAQAMLDHDGVLADLPQEIYALHCGPFPVGTFGIMPGVGAAGHDNVDLELIGQHEITKADNLTGAIAQLATVNPPTSAAGYSKMLADLQTANGPYARFVFAGSRTAIDPDGRNAHVHGWIKAWPENAYPIVRDQIRNAARGVYGTAVADRLAFRDTRSPAMVCSPELSISAGHYFRETLGPESVITLRAMLPFNGEDFAAFLRHIPGAMFFLGVADPAGDYNGQIHSPFFAADERAISIGTRTMSSWLTHRLHTLAETR